MSAAPPVRNPASPVGHWTTEHTNGTRLANFQTPATNSSDGNSLQDSLLGNGIPTPTRDPILAQPLNGDSTNGSNQIDPLQMSSEATPSGNVPIGQQGDVQVGPDDQGQPRTSPEGAFGGEIPPPYRRDPGRVIPSIEKPPEFGMPSFETYVASDEQATNLLLSRADLTLADTIASVLRYFPEIAQSQLQQGVASGMVTEAFGAYDTKLEGYSLSEPTGFYRTQRNGIGVARQTWWGTYLSAGYRIGRGLYQPWYLERETNKGGEFKLAMAVPLLQGRAIDAERVRVLQARLELQAAEPLIQESILGTARDAALAYWDWVAAGRALAAERQLLEFAEIRGEQFKIGVEAGKFAEVDIIFNNQLIAERSAKVLSTEQKLQSKAAKLSLYLRDETGIPILPSADWLPSDFPRILPLPQSDFRTDLAAALTYRPEPRALQIDIQSQQLEIQLARNNLLPALDFVAEASQDVGTPTSSKNDKGRFELIVGLQTEVPIQRRKARGKIQSTNAKIAQLQQKLRLTQDKIGVELQDAYSKLVQAAAVYQQTRLAYIAANDTLARYRIGFEQGKTDLIYINFLETKAIETLLKLQISQRDWFDAIAMLQAALGLDPLDESQQISALPLAEPIEIPEFVVPADANDILGGDPDNPAFGPVNTENN